MRSRNTSDYITLFFKGIFMSIKRILSCHPMKFLGGGEGFDPVNKKTKMKIKK